MILPFSNMDFAEAANSDVPKSNAEELREKTKDLDKYSREYFELVKRGPLDVSEIQKAKEIINGDKSLKLSDKNSIDIYAVSFTGDLNNVPVNWFPVVHILDNDEIVSIELDLQKEIVKNVSNNKQEKLALDNAFAIAQYNGANSIFKSIGIVVPDQPTDFTADPQSGFAAHLLNAKMYNSDLADLCDPLKWTTDYWMQMGYLFKSTGWQYVATDTSLGCYALPFGTSWTPAATDDISFKIYAGSTWWGVLYNISQSQAEYYSKSGMNYGYIGKGDMGTSVFLENHYTSNDWDDQFTDVTLPTNSAQIQKTNYSWIDWSAESQYIGDCMGGTQTDNVISGTLASGGSINMNVETMADNWPAC